MFDELEKWFLEKRDYFLDRNITIRVNRPLRTDNTCIYVDLETEKIFARITLWELGDFQLEAMEAENAKSLIFEAHRIKDKEQLLNMMEDFVLKIW